jgi:hypothetical protein
MSTQVLVLKSQKVVAENRLIMDIRVDVALSPREQNSDATWKGQPAGVHGITVVTVSAFSFAFLVLTTARLRLTL